MATDPQSYDRLADHFEHLSHEHDDVVSGWLPSVLPARRGSAVDLGSGAGRHALQLASQFETVLAVDLSESMTELARRTRPAPNIEHRTADALTVAGTYDLVFSSAMLHHVDDLAAVLRHVKGLVAPGGRAVLVDVTAPSNRLYRLAIALAPRTFYRLGAARSLLTGLLTRDPGARRRYRLETHKPWLDHLATDRFLTTREFDDTYTAAFPGARIVPIAFMRACVWDAPA